MDLQVLYEDNHLIAVYKPSGMLVQGDETGDETLMDKVKRYLKEKYAKPGQVFLGLIHRLDRPVSGIVLFAKTSKGASRLSEQFRTHEVEKLYHAVVIGCPKIKSETLIHYLCKNEEANKVAISLVPQPEYLRAELSYEVVKNNADYSLLKIRLGTGRSHQIRAQLSAIGCPILGDLKYGAPQPLPDKSLALSATSLRFRAATGDEEKIIEVPLPHPWTTYLA